MECLKRRLPRLYVSVSSTTRPLRKSLEVGGREYSFLSEAEFAEQISHGSFLEWAVYDGNYYGTPKGPVMEKLAAGSDVILEIDLEGARQVLEHCPAALMIFIMPPSMEELRTRLVKRGTQTPASLDNRLARAREEMAAVRSGCWGGSRDFDYVIVNDDLNEAVERLSDIITDFREDDEQTHS